MMQKIINVHERDPNFPLQIIEKIQAFLNNEDVFLHPEQHSDLIQELKMEAALISNNSPYAEVRAVVSNTDDPTTPSSTIRAWIIGLLFVVGLAFVNQLFTIRQPQITVMANVAQLLTYPVGKAAASWLPDIGFTLFGIRHSLNPGPFNKKEHMLITIMANVGWHTPYTNNIIWSQYLPSFYNQAYAGQFAYQICIAMATNFIGYGIAGLCRRFLVYPSYCVWPASLVTIALNSAFHTDKNVPVQSPFGRIWTMSRLKFFCAAFTAMFVYFWFPNFLFQALSIFNWMNWIAPDNLNLAAITGFNNGLGLNPFPTFDWNILLWDETDPLMVPFFSTFNKWAGQMLSLPVILGVWYTNAYNTGYIPINTNRVYDNTGHRYNISRAINDKGHFDSAKYEAYSPAFLGAANLILYMFFFAVYSATVSYAYLYHRHEISMGFRNLWNSFRKNKGEDDGKYEYKDVHNKLMAAYEEGSCPKFCGSLRFIITNPTIVPEWWYFIALLFAISFGCAGIAAWETYTSVGVIFYGIAFCLIFVIPIGIVKAITGIEVTLNVLAEFIGGSWVAGNALAMNYFKSFGYVTCATALRFTNDLKLAHYVKIPPKQTFFAQMVATLISTLVCTGVLNFQMNNIPDVCTPGQKNHYTCPGITTFFTASVLWGTIGPPKLFGKGGQYTAMLVGFPIGFLLPIGFYYLQKAFPKKSWLRAIHPVVLMYGGISWSPYNISYVWPAVPIAYASMIWCKKRYLGFWSKVGCPLPFFTEIYN